MDYLIPLLQLIVGLSILNVWLLRNKQATRWRGGDATNIMEEFREYGLPSWSVYIVGTLKVILAILLIAGIWYPVLQFPSAIGLAALLTGSIIMHIKIGDPWIKSIPAALFLVMCLVLAGVSWPL